jgi:hypothetical protein
MIVQGIREKKAQAHLCREDLQVEGAGKTNRLHTLYDWGASVTLVTQDRTEAGEEAILSGSQTEWRVHGD